MVPKPLQQRVWATYRPGQEIDKQPSAEWHAAAQNAIAVVAALERQRAEKAQKKSAQQTLWGEAAAAPLPKEEH